MIWLGYGIEPVALAEDFPPLEGKRQEKLQELVFSSLPLREFQTYVLYQLKKES